MGTPRLPAPGPAAARGGDRDPRRARRRGARRPSRRCAALPGVGEYTAAAIASFAHGRRHVVLDTNVRRVLARLEGGPAVRARHPHPRRARARRRLAARRAGRRRRAWAAASMELGALVCTADAPRGDACPVRPHCAWLAAGRPPVGRPAEGRARPTPAPTASAAASCWGRCATPADAAPERRALLALADLRLPPRGPARRWRRCWPTGCVAPRSRSRAYGRRCRSTRSGHRAGPGADRPVHPRHGAHRLVDGLPRPRRGGRRPLRPGWHPDGRLGARHHPRP